MKSYLEIGLRSFRLKVVRGKLKVGSCKVLPDLSFLLSVRPTVEGSLEQGTGHVQEHRAEASPVHGCFLSAKETFFAEL